MSGRLGGWAREAALSALRIVSGFMMFPHGGQKLFGWFGGLPADQPPVEFPSQVWFGGAIELVGGLLIMFGLCTRAAAFVLSGTMAVAYWQFHGINTFASANSFDAWLMNALPSVNMGELAVLYCFIFLFFVIAGGGRFGIDSLLFGKRRGAEGAE
jgi:putative oxidoreductase